jgi:hypothetical protein
MPKIKLSEWADRHNLSYITANRHFHAGLIPGAVQLDSGTILVEDTSEQPMTTNASSNDAMSLFLKKTVEFSKNDASVEDFAAFVISNFKLQLNNVNEGPKYSKNRPKPEEVQKHFQQFLPDKEKAEQLKAMKNLLKDQTLKKDAAPFIAAFNEEPSTFDRVVDTVSDELSDELTMGAILSDMAPKSSAVHVYGPQTTAEGLVTRSVDLDTTPQQINYTGSTNLAFNSSNFVPSNISVSAFCNDIGGAFPIATFDSPYQADGTLSSIFLASSFQPTQKELLSAVKVIEVAETEDAPRKRGRKPTFKKR